ncbi:CPBP family intramembrane glutamic endopeptidase [Halorubrum ezzemoulense]|uniref:CPBP family intramembrane glutamic endopeptidase n=1 Tax=Halorubrum ezzemoulense TaxID=337243 RepID=UPI002330F6C7|nr:type II CAAX endopeptidase family protein [Halorubrum ezzemoulense]MDB9253969.1 type II CAAX endopeptidase family protein [Halorubrum ezzemoulense]MDB9257445.1 type II CAAX endopeptidase family protein [Halorubrum ezzemoulense]MDB9278092.1 type II CAAX endopeptidase family protein [Halorubrum ezzemoulense]
MVDLPSTLEATVPNHLDDETGVASAVAFIALTIPITIVLNLAASLAAVSAVGSDAGATLIFLAGSIATELSFLLVGIGYVSFRSSFQVPIHVPDRDTVPPLVGGLGMGFATAFLSLVSTDTVLPSVELSPGFMEYTNLAAPAGVGLVIAALLSLALIGPVEEFFFRGVIQQRLRASFSAKTAIGAAALVFALFHVYPVLLLSPPMAAVAHMTLYYSLMGGIFGWVFERTGTFVAPALVHGIFNAVVFVVPLLT